MAVSISVSEVRAYLSRSVAAKPAGDGTPTTAGLGTIFHRIASELLNTDSECSLQAVLIEQEPDLDKWKAILKQHTYDQLLGPLLTQQAGVLVGHGSEILNLWTAVQHLTDWLADVWWEITRQGQSQPNQSEWLKAERPVICELNRPGWQEPVVLLGQTDAVLRIPNNGRWCVLDWKTGRTSPEIDLLQACLYHLMLNQNNASATGSALAVVSFRPELSESVFTHSQIEQVQSRLLDVIEKLAEPAWRSNTEPVRQAVGPGSVSKGQATAKPSISKPSVANIQNSPAGTSSKWQQETLLRILQVLSEFGAPSRKIREPAVGPAFVRFYVYPQRGITVKKVMSAGEQLHLRLALASEPVMTVVEGAIAIDLPRPDRQSLPFSVLRPHLPTWEPTTGSAKVPIGMDLEGQWQWCDLADSESCHMLIVGTPGSGKSEWLRIALATLLMTNTVDTLALLLIDPKRNAFTFAEHSPLLRQPIMVPGVGPDPSEVLAELVAEMEHRNALLQSSNSRTLCEHIQKTGDATKRVIVICDEYAALLDGASTNERKAIEGMFKRLAQMGRAPGFHLILATQQPRVNIITPAIRSLLPAKVALRVADGVESRVAIEENGAQQLLGNGDLIFKCIGTRRLQGAWLPTEEEAFVTSGSDVVV